MAAIRQPAHRIFEPGITGGKNMGNKKQTDQAEVQTQEVKPTIEEISTEAADAERGTR